MTIYYDLGKHRRSIKTKSADAQGWFDRGLIWCYAYNHEEADRMSATSVIGTNRTYSDVRLESAFRGKAEDMGSQRVFRLLTHNGLLLPARYTTLADLFLTPSVEQLSRYGAVS
jgi:hypothetical protein